jgi:two-component system sensor histidine kinase PilS (NtrC family)
MAFSDFFKNITPVRDTDEQLRSHILWFIFIRVLLFTLLLGITYVFHSKDRPIILPPSFVTLTFILVLYGYSIASALYLQKQTIHLRRFGLIQLLSDTIFMALLVYATGCSQSIFTAVFILPIIAGGLILYRIGGLIPASAATILYGIVLTLEYLNYIPAYFHDARYIPLEDFLVAMNVFAVYGLTFFLIALLSGMLAQRLRKTEDALTRTEQKFDRLLLLYKQIFDDIITGIITVDDADFITSFNPAAENITGYPQKDMTGRRLKDIFPQLCTDSGERHVADLEKKNGINIRVGFSCSTLRMSSDPALNEPACTNCKVITLQDISRVEEMEQQVRKAEKMAAIGELSASIAHDFRNPLAAISGSAQILDIELDKGQPNETTTQHSLSKIILRESDRMARTITNFLDYARPATPTTEWFNLRKLAMETTDAISKIMRNENISCRIQLTIPDRLEIYADRQLIQLALGHLLKNSCYASRKNQAPIFLSAIDEADGNQIIIEVKDQGEGFAAELKEKMTDPFFSTREDTAGLGLAIVQQIVASHGGEMEINGGENQGCTVRITLPTPESTPEPL